MAYTTIDKSNDYFNTKLYTGNGTVDHAITGVGFAPDWVWIKNRDQADNHRLTDTVRGAAKELYSAGTFAEDPNGGLTSFDSDGFTLNTNAAYNTSSEKYVSWNWLAGGTASSNTDGSITSNVSASTTSGFSIVGYTGNATAGATVGHGLGVVPKMIIVKSRSVGDGWRIYHVGTDTTAPEDKYLVLNNSNAVADSAGYWNDTAPTSSFFTLGTAGEVNGSGNNHIAYCFADIKGFSKFGSYTGNGSDNFIYTGFKPAFFLVKNISNGTQDWFIYDNKRDSINVMETRLRPNKSDAENTNTAYYMDFLSNGMCLKTGNTGFNGSGNSFIYMAFAENPFVTSTGIPATAR